MPVFSLLAKNLTSGSRRRKRGQAMEKLQVDFIVKNGRVIDPAQGVDGVGTIAVRNRRMAAVLQGAEVVAECEFDAQGCLVVPGLIDFHTHYYHRATATGLNPDIAFLAEGVTTAVDQGSAGISGIRNHLDCSSRNAVKSRFFLHVSPYALINAAHAPEPYLPEKWDREEFRAALEYGRGRIIGLKMRATRDVVRETGARAFYESVKLAEDLGTRLTVHIPDPPLLQSEIAKALRAGDVMSHIFHGRGNTIYENGKIAPEIYEARARGVWMDVAHGGSNLSLGTAARAVAGGFLPDSISTDQIRQNYLHPSVYNLPYVMSQFLAMGMSVADIIRCVTATPAIMAGMAGEVGTLAPGAAADIAILKLSDIPTVFQDSGGETLEGEQLFVPQATFLDGELVYKPIDSLVRRSLRGFPIGV